MANKMLIDATHPEETRVVVLRGSRVEEFDFESASKRQLRGNIYLAKVIRVEPSLQAAFVDYGGNRHGFLAFSEIHPDYYQIPVSDRQALLEEEAREHQEEEVERRPRQSRRRRGERHASAEHRGHDEVVRGPVEADEHADASHPADHETAGSDTPAAAASHAPAGEPSTASQDVRPVQLDASQTPPYDDPTPELIEHASEVRSGTVEEPVEAKQVEAKQVEAKQVETPVPEPTAETASAPAGTAAQAGPPVTAVDAAEAPTAAPDAPSATDASVDTGSPEAPAEAEGSDEQTSEDHEAHDHEAHDHEALDDETNGHEHAPAGRDRHRGRHHHDDDADEHDEEEPVDQLGGDAMEEIPRAPYRPRRQYKIQEVIKRRQVLLVQVVKEERGNKGAALTTYLSLAGRYSVLMPNTARGGGISRKITDAGDRQRLKSIAQELEVPDGMGVILRTAGAARTKPEVKRDFEYLMRMWETVREMTLASTAPKLVYEEGSLIKRAIRDLYNKDVEEIVVAGEDGYREAKDFMRLLMPSHAKNVQPWRDPAPIFTKAGAEAQLDAMFSNHVTLKSGGYLVINQTEALVAIDVNSGRSTREHNIEDTAVRTNLEAADEVARQLRLRDLAGLIVVDFIDMEEGRNNRAVERRIKDALKDDRARIQIGRISHFGLLEMSRQRIRTGVLEGSTEVCQHCAGAGTVRSVASIALHVLRLLEDALISDASRNITVRTRASVALYILNNKRVHLTELEGRFGVAVSFETDEHLTGTVYCGLERGEPATGPVQPIRPVYRDEPEPEVAEAGDEDEAEASGDAPDGETSEENGDSRRRRRRRRGRGRDRESSGIAGDAPQPADDALGFITAVEDVRGSGDDSGEEGTASEAVDADGEQALREEGSREEGKGRRRRSRRGGRRGRPDQANGDERTGDGGEQGDADHPAHSQTDGQSHSQSQGEDTAESTDEAPEPAPLAASKHPDEATQLAAPHPDPVDEAPATKDPAVAGIDTMKEPEPAPDSAASAERAAVVEGSKVADDVENTGASQDSRPKRPEPVSSELDPSRPKKSGWWQRAKATLGG